MRRTAPPCSWWRKRWSPKGAEGRGRSSSGASARSRQYNRGPKLRDEVLAPVERSVLGETWTYGADKVLENPDQPGYPRAVNARRPLAFVLCGAILLLSAMAYASD